MDAPYVNGRLYAYTLKPSPATFCNSGSAFDVSNSTYAKDCFGCSGKGDIVCPECHGTKGHKCSRCGGSGQIDNIVNCSSCNGNGYVMVNRNESYWTTEPGGERVYRTRTVSERKTCTSCNRKGTVKRGMKPCPGCGGSGWIECPSCGGKGRKTCQVCKGEGRLVHLVELHQQFRHEVLTRHFVNMSDPDFELYREAMSDADYVLIDSRFNHSGALSAEAFADIPIAGIREGFANCAGIEAGKAVNDVHLLFQKQEIYRSRLLLVTYEWEKERFELWLTESGRIFASNSPISLYGEVQRENAREALGSGDPYRAYKSLASLADLSDREEYHTALETLRGILKADVKTGAMIAAAFMFVLAMDINAWYLQNYGFAAPWIDLHGFMGRKIFVAVPLLYSVIQFALTYIAVRLTSATVGTHVPSTMLRLLAGVLLGIVAFVTAVAAIYLLPFLILPAVIETVGFVLNIIPSLFFGVDWF